MKVLTSCHEPRRCTAFQEPRVTSVSSCSSALCGRFSKPLTIAQLRFAALRWSEIIRKQVYYALKSAYRKLTKEHWRECYSCEYRHYHVLIHKSNISKYFCLRSVWFAHRAWFAFKTHKCKMCALQTHTWTRNKSCRYLYYPL